VITGTLVNSAAVLAGSVFGLVAGKYIKESFRNMLMNALGLAVTVIALKMALSAQNLIPMVACLLLGGITGELMRIEDGIAWVGERLKQRVKSESATFVQGFMSATVLYLTGAMVIVGCITEGTTGDGSILFLKSILDGVSSIALTTTMGVGVAFSSVAVLVVQGGLTLAASHLTFLQQPPVLAAINATGGMMILGIGINLLELKKIRVGNFIPALAYAVIYGLYF
jgi:uncharacterized membrane protein YqgA involved in biofilm formation